MTKTKEESRTSYIEDHEIDEAKCVVQENIGFKPPSVKGYNMLVSLHIRPEDVYEFKDAKGNTVKDKFGNAMYFDVPAEISATDKYRSAIGLVVAQGDRCYTQEEYKDSGPMCRVGDFIVFPRNEIRGTQILFKGKPMHVITDKCVYQTTEGPGEIHKIDEYRVLS